MKSAIIRIFNPGNYPEKISVSLLMLRVSVGILMLTHGYGKFMKLFSDEPLSFADPVGIGEPASMVLTVFAEFFCSFLLIFGAGTRLAAIPPLITMLVVLFIVHIDDPFNKMELPILFSVIYLILIITGAGKYSVDRLISESIRK